MGGVRRGAGAAPRKQRTMNIELEQDVINVTKGQHTIRINAKHAIYVRDVVTQFDYYYGSVEPVGGVVDFSKPAFHYVKGYPEPILFPSFSEPLESTRQYLDFAQLKPGDIVLDLGAYSGLTSILFAQAVGESGRVVAVEADAHNWNCLRENIAGFKNIHPVFGAMWEHCNGVEFSTETNMGSSAAAIVGKRGEMHGVPSYTLTRLMLRADLDRVDFIKCDIEGAEKVIFHDVEFFKTYQPRMIIETHHTDEHVIATLVNLGYHVKRVTQNGVRFPLLECVWNR